MGHFQLPRLNPAVGKGLGGLPRRRVPAWSVRPDSGIAVPSAIPQYDKCVLLLPMNGDNNGTTFTDYSPSPKTITRAGHTKTVTAQSKFYGTSGYFDGNGDYLLLDGSSEFAFSGDFTIAFWLYKTLSAVQVLFDFRPAAANGWFPYLDLSADDKLGVYMNAGYRITGTSTIPNGTWVHLELSRSGSDVRLFYNGNQEGATYATSLSLGVGSARPAIMCNGSSVGANAAQGYVQDFSVWTGVALHTSNFTPPPRMMGALSNSAADPIRDATGAPASRRIFAVPRGYAGILTGRATTSDSVGRFSIANVPMTEHNIIVESADARFNDYLIPRVMPT